MRIFGFLRKYWLFIFLAALAAFLSFLWFILHWGLPVPAPAPAPELEPVSSRLSEPVNGARLSIGVSPPALPSSVAVFSVATFSPKTIPGPVQKLAELFGLELARPTATPAPGFLVWQQEGAFLSLEVPSGRFQLSGKVKVAESFSATTATTFARTATVQYGLAPEVFRTEMLGFVAVDTQLVRVKNLAAADIFAVEVIPMIDQLPVVGAGKAQMPLEIFLTRDGYLTKIRFSLHLPAAQLGNYPVDPWANLVAGLQAGKGQTLWLQDKAGNAASSLSLDPLVGGNITRAYLAYFDGAEEQKTLQPVFVFEGSGKALSGEERKFAVFVPAVAAPF